MTALKERTNFAKRSPNLNSHTGAFIANTSMTSVSRWGMGTFPLGRPVGQNGITPALQYGLAWGRDGKRLKHAQQHLNDCKNEICVWLSGYFFFYFTISESYGNKGDFWVYVMCLLICSADFFCSFILCCFAETYSFLFQSFRWDPMKKWSWIYPHKNHAFHANVNKFKAAIFLLTDFCSHGSQQIWCVFQFMMGGNQEKPSGNPASTATAERPNTAGGMRHSRDLNSQPPFPWEISF